MQSKKYLKLIPWAYLLLAMLSVRRYLTFNPLSFGGGAALQIEYFGIFFLTCLYPVFSLKFHKTEARCPQYKFLNCYLLVTLLLCVYSLFANYPLGNKYERMYLLDYYIAVMSGISVFFLADPDRFTDSLRKLFKYLPILAICYLPIADPQWVGDMVGFILMPIALPLLFWKDLPRKRKIIYFCLVVYVVLTSFWGDARSHVIKYGMAFLFGSVLLRFENLLYLFRHFVWVVITIPFVLFYLAITGTFNIFEYTEGLDNSNLQENSLTDTRTYLYVEALTSAVNNDYILFGRGIGRGYDSLQAEGRFDKNENSVVGAFSYERNAETSIVNTFTWGGVVYLLFFLLMSGSIIYYGYYRANNSYARIVALYYVFYIVYCWVENFQSMSISYFSSWFFAAICLSSQFREMTDEEFNTFIEDTF